MNFKVAQKQSLILHGFQQAKENADFFKFLGIAVIGCSQKSPFIPSCQGCQQSVNSRTGCQLQDLSGNVGYEHADWTFMDRCKNPVFFKLPLRFIMVGNPACCCAITGPHGETLAH